MLAEGAAGATWVAGDTGGTEPTVAGGVEVAVEGEAVTAGRTTGAGLTGVVAGEFVKVDWAEEAAGTVTGAIGATLEAASLGAEAAGSACSEGSTCIGGGGSALGVDAGCCITAAKPKAATNKAMMYHKEFLLLGLSSLSKAEFVDF